MQEEASTSAHEVLDLDVIKSLRELGGEQEPGLVLELVDLFLSDAHRRLAEMQLALDRGNLDEVARAAHTLKSSAGSMGANLLSSLCTEIESLARSDEERGIADRARSCLKVYEVTADALRDIEA